MKPGSPTALLQSLTMTDQTAKALAIWKAKTKAKDEAEQVEWIAVEIMKWHNVQARGHDESSRIWAAAVARDQNHYWDFVAEIEWNPLTNWNDWRSVEMKIMEDLELSHEYILVLMKGERQIIGNVRIYMKATLPERCEALYLAYISLHPTL